MKKVFFSVLALATLLFASCQQENLEPVAGGSQVSFTVEAPAAMQTKAIGDGQNVNQLIYEVWFTPTHGDLENGAQRLYCGETDLVSDGTVNKATLTLDLVNDQNFTVLFWAQVKNTGVYNTSNLNAVTYYNTAAKAYAANNESLAAFYAVAYVADTKHVKYEDGEMVGTNGKVALRRPFAQINLGTTNTSDKYAVVIEKSKMKLSSVPTVFNVVNSEVSDFVEMEFSLNNVPTDPSTLTVNRTTYQYAGMNYVFAGNDTPNITVSYDIQTRLNGGVEATVTNIVPNVPLVENYRTNIIGNLLTSQAEYDIFVDPAFVEGGEFEVKVVDGVSYNVISTPEDLQLFADLVNSGAPEWNEANFTLNGDIDLAQMVQSRSAQTNWVPMGSSEQPYTGVFDGNGHTLKNLNIVENEPAEGKAYIGFFGYAEDATIKNVTFENVNINIPCLDIDHSQGHIGAVAGSLEGKSTIENVTVKGDIKVYATQDANGASRVGVVAGGNAYGDVTMKNVHVIANEGSYLIANNNTGALAGQLQGKMVFENCSSNINVTVNKFFAGGLVGLAAGDSKFINCHTTGDVAVVAGRAGRGNDHYRVGGIAGGWADGKTKVCTLENCSYTGKVSGMNADGSVAEELDYLGFVGRGYTLTNCAGSKVIIDGTEFVQKYDTQYGSYYINIPVKTAEELVSTLATGNGVIFKNDITVAATEGGYNKAGILQNKAQTIDGNGYTLTVTGAGATWDCAIYTNGGTIKNLIVAGAMRGVFTAGQSSDLYIDNVEFKNVIYTFNSDGKMPAEPYGVYVSNSKVNGWTSHSNMHTEVVYTNCSFGQGSGYKYCRPYGLTNFVNCTFCPGYTIDKSMTTDITFTDCTFEE